MLVYFLFVSYKLCRIPKFRPLLSGLSHVHKTLKAILNTHILGIFMRRV